MLLVRLLSLLPLFVTPALAAMQRHPARLANQLIPNHPPSAAQPSAAQPPSKSKPRQLLERQLGSDLSNVPGCNECTSAFEASQACVTGLVQACSTAGFAVDPVTVPGNSTSTSTSTSTSASSTKTSGSSETTPSPSKTSTQSDGGSKTTSWYAHSTEAAYSYGRYGGAFTGATSPTHTPISSGRRKIVPGGGLIVGMTLVYVAAMF